MTCEHQNSVAIVWLKRDLRVRDHRPLVHAAQQGQVLGLYIFEPELYRQPDFDSQHFHFIRGSLKELERAWAEKGGRLITRKGDALQVFRDLGQEFAISAIWAHQETGNDFTFQRDKAVGMWAQAEGIPFHEVPQDGVVRRLKTRAVWSKEWERRMALPLVSAPKHLASPEASSDGLLEASDFGLSKSPRPENQKPGEELAWQTIRSFLKARCRDYEKRMSSPTTAWHSCSRLSAYLAYGNLSMRQVVRLTRKKIRESRQAQARSLDAFESRLHWHCHFIQKLESEPEIEFQNMNRGYDGLRERDFDQALFESWCQGRTGFPLVDACIRALHQGGWINFRMRAMLVSFCCHNLWLHWRQPSLYLARQFLDYEPGIHFSQFQMQAGTAGINSLRIYNPVKQAQELDPTGEFICRYLPELEALPAQFRHQPYLMSLSEQQRFGVRLGKDYPTPVVDHLETAARARKRLEQRKKMPQVRQLSKLVLERHGSRKGKKR